MAGSYDIVARKSEESYPRSKCVALIVVATDNLLPWSSWRDFRVYM